MPMYLSEFTCKLYESFGEINHPPPLQLLESKL
jgi:hypothetical protein